ncbi:MAG: tRNA (adenosine(37)-N6)-dimethylallyltransferase MiaA, partial [Lentilactobacillus diolivorans]|jgi:tRNA dimethylallyltransferase|nr:tRNA (adenosine(37)-N6)-dimethylallyltransferase MiaA [Lentilactobacillus diolivorans]
VALVKQDSRHYAKRQLTWFRNKTHPNWYNIIEHHADVTRLISDVSKWLSEGV